MKRIRLLFVMAWLCLVLNALKAQQFPTTYYSDEVHFAMGEKQKWFANRNAIMSNNMTLVAPEFQQLIDGKTYYLNVQFDGANYKLDSEQTISFFKPNGRYTLRMEMMEKKRERIK